MPKPDLTVVAIDDYDLDLACVRRHLNELEDIEVQLHTFTEPIAAMTFLVAHPVDVILIDYFLGHEIGLQVIKRFRQASINAPTILLTGRGDEKLAVEAFHEGIDDYLPKSMLSKFTLRKAICDAVEKHALKRAIEKNRIDIEKQNTRLRDKNAQISKFHHTLSHELRNPLQAILSVFSEIKLDANTLSDIQTQLVDAGLFSGEQMLRQINDLLDSVRLETGKIVIEKKIVDAKEFLKNIQLNQEPFARDRKINLDIYSAPSLKSIYMDDVRIAQVLNNLVQNAIKFTPQHGSISVAARKDSWKGQPAVYFSVADTGNGIASSELGRITERLYQSKTESLTESGLGLGLYITKHLVKRHNGDIWIDSEVGKGTTCKFVIPQAC